MALVNYSLPFGSLGGPGWATVSPIHSPPHATAVNSLLYGPSGHQENDLNNEHHDYYKNNPYAPPEHIQQQQQQQQAQQYRARNNYLPPKQPSPQPPAPTQYQPQNRNGFGQNSRTYGESSYSQSSASSSSSSSSATSYSNLNNNNNNGNNNNNNGYYNANNANQNYKPNPYQPQPQPQQQPQVQTTKAPIATARTTVSFNSNNNNKNNNNNNGNNMNNMNNNNGGNLNLNQAGYPERPPGFTKVQAGIGSNTQVHAVLDYDDDEDEYYEEDDGSSAGTANGNGNANGKGNSKSPRVMPVTPIQGPIFLQNGSVPVLPLYAYPKVYNGTFMQIPIWWTALSVALGLNVRGDVIRGVPCVKRYHQLFCPTAGNSYPIDKIESFIDENKALMKRMYGYFEAENEYGSQLQQGKKRKRMVYGDDFNPPNLPDLEELYGPPGDGPDPVRDAGPTGDSYFNKMRKKRQSRNNSSSSSSRTSSNAGSNAKSDTGRVDACESKVEIVTPYWASNSAGKIRAIVNTQHFEQAIHQEVCSKVQTNRCAGECGCEQKYKWHRLLAYDPDNDCKGIFMDWFLFPSCCVCRCNPL